MALCRGSTLPALCRSAGALERALADAPADERIPLALGSHHLLLGDLRRAESWYRRSLELAPRAETYLNLGRALWLRGEREAAAPLFAAAVTVNPALAAEVPAPARGQSFAGGTPRIPSRVGQPPPALPGAAISLP